MRSRALSAVAAAGVVSSGTGGAEERRPALSAVHQGSSDDEDEDSSNSNDEQDIDDARSGLFVTRPSSSSQTMSAPTPLASNDVLSPESAPTPSSSSSTTSTTTTPVFLRQRSTADVTDSDDDDLHREGEERNVSQSFDPAAVLDGNRFNGPSLARRRYPSTPSGAVNLATTRRMSSKSRRTSASTGISRNNSHVFDVKGKGRAIDNDDNDNEHSGNLLDDTIGLKNFASLPSEYDHISQGPRTAPLPLDQIGSRRSISHSHPSRRYTTSFDITGPERGDLGDSSMRVKKKRSYSIAGGGGSGSGKSRNVSGSSTPDRVRNHNDGTTSFTHISQQINSGNRKSNHLPRSASDFMIPSNSPNTSFNARPSNTNRKSNSGSTSPLYTSRSQSSGNIFNSDIHANHNHSGTIPSRSGNIAGEDHKEMLRHKLSSLHMKSRSRSKTRISPVKTTFQATPSTSAPSKVILPQRNDSNSSTHHASARKRAKSALYPLHGSHLSQAEGLNGLSPSARSASSQHVKRWSMIDGEELEGQLDTLPREREDIVHGKRVHMDDSKDVSFPSTSTMQHSPANGILGKSILKSGSQPVSIAAMVLEQNQADSSSQSMGGTNQAAGPSLQELLGQVDLKSAFTLVREATGNNGDTSLFQSNNEIRNSIDTVPTSYRSNSPSKSIKQSIGSSRTSAASPGTIGSHTTRSPLLPSSQHESVKNKTHAMDGGSRLQPSATIHIVPTTFSSVTAKRRNRLSMKRLLGHHSASHSRASSHDTSYHTDGRSSTIGSNSFVFDTTSESHEPTTGVADSIDEIRTKVDPIMKKYISSVKTELEIRYLPIFTALAMGQNPPNPLAVARYLNVQEENNRKSSGISLNSLSPDSDISRRYIEEARNSSSYSIGKGQQQQQISLADRIRKKGHKRSVWEVYPRDIAAYSMVSTIKESRRYEPYDGHRSDVLEALSRGRNVGHRHGSSEISLGSLASIREDSPLDAFRSDNKHRRNLSHSASNTNGGRYTLPLSPSQSRSGQSDISSYIASDDAIIAARKGLHIDENGPGWNSEGNVQSSPEYKNFSTSLPDNRAVKHQSSLSWSSRGFRILRPDSLGSSSDPRHHGSIKPSQSSLLANSSNARKQSSHSAGTESEGGGTISDGHTSSSRRPIFHRSTASDVEAHSKNSLTNAGILHYKPSISRSTSKTNSLSGGFSKILAGSGKKIINRPSGKEDGYRSNTDNEEFHSPHGNVSTLHPDERPGQLDNGTYINSTANGGNEQETELGTGSSIFGQTTLHIQEIDIGNEEMERAERFLHDLKASLSKAEALERRAPPKMQTYLQNYFDYDAQRLQKGQLASIHLPPPPMLCRHFLSAQDVLTASHAGSGTNSTSHDGGPIVDVKKLIVHSDHPGCKRKNSGSSLDEEDKRMPLLETVAKELDDATATLEEAVKRSKEITTKQDTAKDRITETVKMADAVERLIGGEVFQQLRMLEDHLMRLKYHSADTRAYADAAWAVLSYILRIFFWFSWIGVTILRLIKATVLLPFTVVVTILRWIFL